MRARPCRVWLAAFSAGTFAAAAWAPAQAQPAPGDTVPQDTIVVTGPSGVEPGDTVPTALARAAESRARVPVVPAFPDPQAGGWASARWVLLGEEIGRLPGLTLLEILERLPGMAGFRAGGFGRPEGLTALGLGGARLRVFVDGLEMAPLGAGAFELESIPLLDIERVLIERSVGEIRVDVRTFRLEQPEAHSAVELGTGIYQTRLLRALFSRGFGGRSVGTGGFDLVTTRGFGIREAYSHSSAVFRYGYAVTQAASLQAEWRRTAIDREGLEFPRQTTRTDLSLRGRVALRKNVVVEGILARVDQEEAAEAAGAYDARITHAVLRGAFDSALLGAEAALRLRATDDVTPPLPTLDAVGTLRVTPVPMVRLEGAGRFASGHGISAGSASATGVIAPLPGVSVFATLGAGRRPLPWFDGSGESPSGRLLTADVGGWRGGVDLDVFGLSLGLAAFQNAA
ncbi:MAG TPA: TonB-dependent receptor plug domain-containing protein, partial [Longimicrobiaceae bacterium]|nr:TonB-dependent receptor plug domain-containing protein [Longimicrobiaceae bacterium]